MTGRQGTWLFLGGSSGVAKAFSHVVAPSGVQIILAGRDLDDLGFSAANLSIRHSIVASALYFDAAAPDTHAAFVAEVGKRCEGPFSVFLAFGWAPSNAEIIAHPEIAAECIATNYTGAVSVLLHLAPLLESQGEGQVIIMGSVSGDRGRSQSLVYGSAKAGLHAFASGFRARMHRFGVSVLTVKLGFIDTAMTYGLTSPFLMASPEKAARHVLTAAQRGRDVAYYPRLWALIMLVIRHIPEWLFKKMFGEMAGK